MEQCIAFIKQTTAVTLEEETERLRGVPSDGMCRWATTRNTARILFHHFGEHTLCTTAVQLFLFLFLFLFFIDLFRYYCFIIIYYFILIYFCSLILLQDLFSIR